MKKILSGVMAGMLAVSMYAISVSAEGEEDFSTDLEPVFTVPVITDEPEPEPEPEPVTETVVVSNNSPKTGQSPYVIAAIPVALGAAALMMKRKDSK